MGHQKFKRAVAGNSALVSEIAIRSKAHWGYSDEFMQNCRDELTYSPAQLDASEFILLTIDEEPVGFYAISNTAGTSFELGGLFIEPGHMGKGYGGLLLKHAIARVRELGGTVIELDADPNAKGFYLHQGAVVTGESESGSIPGRMLPAMSIAV